MQNIEILLNSSRGIYIPRDFVQSMKTELFGLTEQNKRHWKDAENPDSEYYWESWQWILDNARFDHKDGRVFYLYQDGDVFLVAWDNLSQAEKENFGVEF